MQYVNKGLELVIVYTCLLNPHAMHIYVVPSSIQLATQLNKLIKEYFGCVCVCVHFNIQQNFYTFLHLYLHVNVGQYESNIFQEFKLSIFKQWKWKIFPGTNCKMFCWKNKFICLTTESNSHFSSIKIIQCY